ncbi:MAG TPA: TetR/AcrR family transcriptional regulator [Streptomyces sp.]|uniref:TetR/AcrR family transcriptional regulator n=1 Tax=Streptomyces sp. TaxID=1931 RepID=UPI002C544320|nr:TetR/AcrR family transcriptional regulator [Streptomyces sp.]HWU05059.1 TetR/AcrR family transcriptional regulator [Streptomyces sp.]
MTKSEPAGGTTTGSGDIARSLDLLWGTGERPSRGPKPGLTLDRIVATAVGVADAEGLDALSMRRLATELGTGTMTLYRYVPGKAELLDLMLDRVQGEPLTTDASEVPEDWRSAVEGMAHTYRATLRAHPWLLKINQARTVLGPSALRGLELALTGLRGTGLAGPELIGVIITVNSFVEGLARTENHAVEAVRETGLSDAAFWEGQHPYLERAMLSGDYPHMASLPENAFASGFDHFAFGLGRIIDGLDALVRQRAEQ